MLKSFVFGDKDLKQVSLLEKDEIKEILGRIYKNRSKIMQIMWEFYLRYPIINIAVLFTMLLIVIDFFPAIFATVLYFILTVTTSVYLSFLDEKKLEGN